METSRAGRVMFPAAVVMVVAVMVIPLPVTLIDMLIVANISIAILILLVSMNVTKTLEFSSFPALLLIVTLFRLALNVATSRAVLSNGEAGQVIATFGSVVVGGSLVVGLVIFLILTLVQFVVISNGSGRVAEVSARFTLDAMPGKQMAIDADLNAGAIGEDEARQRRRDVSDEADFYGAMDGASKFVKGDAIAGLVITAVNLIGGFLIGVVQRGMPITEAISTYALLTVGDGLVSQIPALLVSIAAGLIVTRSTGNADLGSDVFAQFSHQGSAIRTAGIMIMLMGLIPGLPRVPFLVIGGSLALLGHRLASRTPTVIVPEALSSEPVAPPSPQQMAHEARIEPLELDISLDLIELVDGASGGDLLDRVSALRRKLAMELGFVMPPVRTRDDAQLPLSSYVIKAHGVAVGQGVAPAGRVLVIGEHLDPLPGDDVKEPVFGLDARWTPVEFRVQAELAGHTVVDRSTLIVTHLSEIVRRRAGRLLSRTDVKDLIDGVRATDPTVIEDLATANLGTADVQRVLATLLDDGIPVRDLVRILEAIGERARTVRTPEALVEAARAELGPAITAALATDGRLSVVTVAPFSEERLAGALRITDAGTLLELAPPYTESLIAQVNAANDQAARRGVTLAVVCSAVLRPALRRMLKSAAPTVAVVSYDEIGDHLEVEVVGQIDLDASRSEEDHNAFAAVS
ncbi:MAG TPA: flagellar biosynthesis protein FlhA [Ilumatobacteraceae bacterium]|nr:flagellar biosynthesis protein FlhA [Ilumatobacteraceae bacterium]